jgi:hypothetical protein
MKIFATLLVATALLTGCNVSFNNDSSKGNSSEPGTKAQQQIAAKAANAFLK